VEPTKYSILLSTINEQNSFTQVEAPEKPNFHPTHSANKHPQLILKSTNYSTPIHHPPDFPLPISSRAPLPETQDNPMQQKSTNSYAYVNENSPNNCLNEAAISKSKDPITKIKLSQVIQQQNSRPNTFTITHSKAHHVHPTVNIIQLKLIRLITHYSPNALNQLNHRLLFSPLLQAQIRIQQTQI